MPLYRIHKRFLTLLETLIAMSLLSILLVIVFGLFRELAVIQDLDKRDRKEVFYGDYVKLRFYEIFSHLANENVYGGKDFYFFTEMADNISSSPSLVFMYNNGVRGDPYNSSYLIGRLYVNNEKNELKLASWPYNLANPHPHMQEETLLPNVESMKFSFLSVDKDFKAKGTPSESVERRGEWQDAWSERYKELPVIMQIQLKIKDDSTEKLYTFALPTHRFAVKLNR